MDTAEAGEIETGSEIGNAKDDAAATESVDTTTAGAKDETQSVEKVASGEKKADEKEGEVAPPIAAYAPNYKLKINEQDFEIPKEFQSLMKDPKTEKMVREVFEKSFGLEFAKPRHEKVKQENIQLKTDLTGIQGQIQDMRSSYQSAVQSKNWLKLEDVFKKLEIPDEVILQYAAAKVNLEDMPPEQRSVLEARLHAERQAETLSREKSSGDQRLTAMSQELKRLSLETGLARPEVKAIADSYDAREGTPGAFAQEVIREGHFEWLNSNGKVDLTPEQAIARVVERRGLNRVQEAPAGASIVAPGEKPSQQPTTRSIPNVAGRSVSPLKNKPESIADLKKLYERAKNGDSV